MKTKPWQDIYQTSEWDELLKNYRKGQMMSKAKTTGQKASYFFTRKYSLPRTIHTLDMQIRHYLKTEKRSVENLQRRAGALRIIAGLGRSFLAEHDIFQQECLERIYGGEKI